jgi:hypothetical protein
MTELRIAKLELFSTGRLNPPVTPQLRNLGGAILLVAIEDYRSLDEEIHKNAKAFLYPATARCREHFEWAVSMAEGVDAAWLRDALDRSQRKWDRQRTLRMGERGQTRTQLMVRRKACGHTRRNAGSGVRSGAVVAMQPGAAGGARDREAAPEL